MKEYYDRLKQLLNEMDTLLDDMKDLTAEIKENGIDAVKLKRLARLDVSGKWQEVQRIHRDLTELAQELDVE